MHFFGGGGGGHGICHAFLCILRALGPQFAFGAQTMIFSLLIGPNFHNMR